MSGSYEMPDHVVLLSNGAKDLISKLLDPNPVTRLSIKDALHHPWCQSGEMPPYIDNYDRFLAQLGYHQMPKHAD